MELCFILTGPSSGACCPAKPNAPLASLKESRAPNDTSNSRSCGVPFKQNNKLDPSEQLPKNLPVSFPQNSAASLHKQQNHVPHMQQQQLHYQQHQKQTHLRQQEQQKTSPTPQQIRKYQQLMKQESKSRINNEVITLDPPPTRLQQSPDSSGRPNTSPIAPNTSPDIQNTSLNNMRNTCHGTRTTGAASGTQSATQMGSRNSNSNWRNSSPTARSSSSVAKEINNRTNLEESAPTTTDSAIAATIANLLKLNSCTITSANVLPTSLCSQEETSLRSTVSYNPTLTSNKTTVDQNSDREANRARSSPQVPSINSTTNVPCIPDKKVTCNGKISVNSTVFHSQDRFKKESVNSNASSSHVDNSLSNSKSVLESPSSVTITHNTQGSLKNSDNIRLSIASALPHLSASMIAKEMSPLKMNCEELQHDRLCVDSASDLNSHNTFIDANLQETVDALSCLSNSTPLRNSDSPCLPFPSNDATDLSVANDLLLLAQSDLQFPLQCNSSLVNTNNVTVSSTSCNDKSSSPPIEVTVPADDPVASSSRNNSASAVDRSNSNSPNPRIGARHLLCQIVPAHSQSKTATARAKPVTPLCQVKTPAVKSEVKDLSMDVSFSTISDNDVTEKTAAADSSCSAVVGTPPVSGTNLGIRKRGRPPKPKEPTKGDKTVLCNDVTIRSESKNGRGIGELEFPRVNMVHQYKLKNSEEKVTSSKKYSPSTKSDSNDSKLGFQKFELKKTLQVKTEAMPKIKCESVSPDMNSPVDSLTKVSSSTNFKLINGLVDNSLNCIHFSDIEKLNHALNCDQYSNAKGQIPNCEELKLVLTEHSRAEGSKFKPGSKQSSDDSKSSKSDSSSSRESSTPPSRNAKLSKIVIKGKSLKISKACKKSSDAKSRCKKSLLAYLKEKNENDTSTVDSDVPSSSTIDALPGSSAGTSSASPTDQSAATHAVVFPPLPAKTLRRRQSSGASKGKIVKKPKWIHGWSWEGEPYQGKVWLRVSPN